MNIEQNKRIAIISTVHGKGHGAEVVLEHLIRAWGKTLPTIVALAPSDSSVYGVARSCGLATLALDTARDALLENLSAIIRLVPQLKDVGLVHAWHARGFELALMLGRRLSCPATGTLHDHPRAFFIGRIRRQMMRFCANRFSRLVLVSHALARVCAESDYRVSSDVILNGLGDIPESAEKIRLRSTCSCNIGFLGMYSRAKGFPVIEQWIEATADLSWKWNLYGEVAPDLKAAADSLVRRWPSRVALRGHVDVVDIFNNIDILVHSSCGFYETFGMILAEAARTGIPAVAADVGGVSEVLSDGETGFLYDSRIPENGLRRLRQLIDDGDLREKFGLAARRRFEDKFTAARMMSEYKNYWASVITNSRERVL